MSTSTDGQICFGIPFEEGYSFPWNVENFDDDLEEWWIYKVHNYQDPVRLYDNNTKTGYVNDRKPTSKEFDLYFNSRRSFLKNHPLPIQLINYCSIEDLKVSKEEINSLINFCETYLKSENDYYKFPKMEPKWYLSSYWG